MGFIIPESVKPKFADLVGRRVESAYVGEYERGYVESVRIGFEGGLYVEFFTDGTMSHNIGREPSQDS
jgi:hypothetical protein